MKDSGFFIGFLVILIALALMGAEKRKETMGTHATSTPKEVRNTAYKDSTYYPADSTYRPSTRTQTERQLTPDEIERKVAQIYRELDALKEDVREARLRAPVSPYADMVTIRKGNVTSKEPETEYLIIQANRKNTGPINISHWSLESYVTDERAFLPDGDRVLLKWRDPDPQDIYLEPGTIGYLVTGESPIDTSFRENACTGYLIAEGDFVPGLRRQCPRPMDELENASNIELDNDRCYDYVERLGTCVSPEEETYTRNKIGGACSVFVENTFNYNDCVRLHRYDPFFTRDGYWRIYLDEKNELWRPEREIIRLLDESGKVVSVIEY